MQFSRYDPPPQRAAPRKRSLVLAKCLSPPATRLLAQEVIMYSGKTGLGWTDASFLASSGSVAPNSISPIFSSQLGSTLSRRHTFPRDITHDIAPGQSRRLEMLAGDGYSAYHRMLETPIAYCVYLRAARGSLTLVVASSHAHGNRGVRPSIIVGMNAVRFNKCLCPVTSALIQFLFSKFHSARF